ncbi:MAG: hypothetical protein EAZ09_22930 [Oscillatoriales cyanobacterium]|nr:MAG: hypothetical protein EAZ18_12745 [Oscillatoriales cyanobacterium]TAH15898.1 MAG: hypothetical protein EAZ09_22930 [Oscillatoriales cyanobacterium]
MNKVGKVELCAIALNKNCQFFFTSVSLAPKPKADKSTTGADLHIFLIFLGTFVQLYLSWNR